MKWYNVSDEDKITEESSAQKATTRNKLKVELQTDDAEALSNEELFEKCINSFGFNDDYSRKVDLVCLHIHLPILLDRIKDKI